MKLNKPRLIHDPRSGAMIIRFGEDYDAWQKIYQEYRYQIFNRGFCTLKEVLLMVDDTEDPEKNPYHMTPSENYGWTSWEEEPLMYHDQHFGYVLEFERPRSVHQMMGGRVNGTRCWVAVDEDTAEWFEKHPFDPNRSVVQCPYCGEYYRPDLNHKCKKEKQK